MPTLGLLMLILQLASVSPMANADGVISWSFGAAYEARAQEDVNPDFPEARFAPQIFAQVHRGRWSGVLEASLENQETSSGALSIRTRTYYGALWGRYKLVEAQAWAPFASSGLGSYLDSVTSSFGGGSDTRGGRRDLFGIGGGVSHVVGERLLLEGEARAVLIEDRKDMAFSGILRLGIIL